MNTLIDPLIPFLRDVLANSAKASLLACAVGVACLMLRRWLSPPWRHVLWCAVFLRLVLPDVPVPGWRWNLNHLIADSSTAPPLVLPTAPMGTAPDSSLQNANPLPLAEPLVMSGNLESTGVTQAAGVAPNSVLSIFPRGPFSIWHVLGLIWLAGTVAWWAALCIGWWRFRRRVLGNSTPATSQVRSLLAECMTESGVSACVELRYSVHIPSPVVCGIARHVILLPDSVEPAISTAELRLLLLHELGHVKRRDSLVQVLASVLLGLHWWNPFLWLAWRQLRNEAEAATDAWVLRRTGEKSAPSYGTMLLTLASRVCATGIPVVLLPSLVSATSHGRRLKQRILDIAAHRAVGAWTALPGLVVLACLMITGFSQETAKKSPEPKSAATTADTIGGIVVDEKGQPIAGAEVEVEVTATRANPAKSVLPPGFKAPAPVKTDSQGHWKLQGVPAGVVPSTSESSLAGKDTYQFFVTHPEFLFRQFNSGGEVPLEDDTNFRQGTAKLVLQRGHVMRGVVRDEDGKPIGSATVERNPTTGKHGDPEVITDAEGRYEMKCARPGNLAVRVFARGYGTHLERVSVKGDTTQDFTLKKAQTLTLKIRDDKNQPVSAYNDQRIPTPLVIIYLPGDSWKSGERLWQSEGTCENGIVVWDRAPPGELVAEISGRGFGRVTRKVTAGGEVLVTLAAADRLPTVTLKVTDAETGAPLKDCTFFTGTVSAGLADRPPSIWMPDSTGVVFQPGAAEGEYTGGIKENHLKYRLGFCVRHEGYVPVMTPRVNAAEGDATLNVALRKGNPVELTVRDDQGNAVPGAKVYAIWQSNYLSLRDFAVRSGSFGTDGLEFAGATGPDGRCMLPPCPGDAAILVTHDSGFAVSAWADLVRRPTVMLGLYAQVEAHVKQEGKPVSGMKYEFSNSMDLPGGRRAMSTLTAVSDAQGFISLPRVLPGSGGSFREPRPPSEPGRNYVFNSGLGDYKKIPVGMTTVFDLEPKAFKFRTLTGRFVVKGGGIPVSSRTQLLMVNLGKPSSTGMILPGGSSRVDDEGRFNFDAVAPGNYTLQFSFPYSTGPPPRYSFATGKASFEVTLPEANAETAGKPVDLGDIELVDTQK